ncbi:hypothetical protein FACS1894218_1640 [Bacilli bacterium]|nr:hypothetical protein FACS1894218_1640 [Bacilli bacterium]
MKYQEALNAYDTALENKVLPFEILASDVMFLTRKNRKEVLLIFVIIDIATRKVIDYCFTINGNDNIPEYLKLMGKSIKDKHVIIFHSDNGVEYTDERTKTLFSKHKVQQSFTDKNSSYQNGTVEGF